MNALLCDLIQGMSAPSPVAAVTALGVSLIQSGDIVTYYPATPTATAWLQIWSFEGSLILIQGAVDLGVVEQLVPGTFGGVSYDSASGASMPFVLAADTILASIPTIRSIAGKPLFIAGHSFGGCTAEVLSQKVQSLQLSSSVRCWSYGAPRPGSQRFRDLMQAVDNSRFMTLLDVVPHLPPNSEDDLSIAAVLTVGQLRLANSLVQPPYGFTVDSSTGIQPARNNAVQLDFVGFQIFGLYFGYQFGPGNAAHAIYNYKLQFQSLILRTHPQVSRPRPIPNGETPIVLTPRQLSVTVAAAEAVIRADATAPGGITRSYVVPPATFPSSPRYIAGRDGKVWVVKLSGQIVGVSTGKRSAKILARKWNRAARATLVS